MVVVVVGVVVVQVVAMHKAVRSGHQQRQFQVAVVVDVGVVGVAVGVGVVVESGSVRHSQGSKNVKQRPLDKK